MHYSQTSHHERQIYICYRALHLCTFSTLGLSMFGAEQVLGTLCQYGYIVSYELAKLHWESCAS